MVVSDEALRPFRSRRGRLVATVMAVVSLVLFAVVAVLLPTNAGLTTWQPADLSSVEGLDGLDGDPPEELDDVNLAKA